MRHETGRASIRAVQAGQKRIPAGVAVELANHATGETLTSREIDVFRLIAAGNATRRLPLSLLSPMIWVKGHVTNTRQAWR